MIQSEDFLSVNVHIKLRNLVSQTFIESGVKMLGNVQTNDLSGEHQVQIVEVIDKGLVISVPRYTCAEGHLLEIELSISNLSKNPFEVLLSGVVHGVEKTAEDLERATVEIKDPERNKQWKYFCGLLEKRQDEIHEFFKSARGY